MVCIMVGVLSLAASEVPLLESLPSYCVRYFWILLKSQRTISADELGFGNLVAELRSLLLACLVLI